MKLKIRNPRLIKRKIQVNTNLKKGALIVLFFAISVILAEKSPNYRKLFYLTFPLIVFLLFYTKRWFIRANEVLKEFYFYIFFWLAFTFISIFFGLGTVNLPRFGKEVYFISSALMTAALIYTISKPETIEKALRLLIILVFLSVFIFDTENIIGLLKLDLYGFLVKSMSATESGLSFVAGICAIFFFLRKENLYFILSVVLVILGSKRITLLTVVVCIVLYYVLNPISKRVRLSRNLGALILLFINLGIILFLVRLGYGDFNEIIEQITGIPANMITMGRVTIISEVLDETNGIPILPKGIGYTNSILTDGTIRLPSISQMHSDILKYCIELGLICYVFIMFFLYRMASRNLSAIIVITYYSMLMITDNITIYFEVMFLVYLALLYFMLEGDRRQNDTVNKISLSNETQANNI